MSSVVLHTGAAHRRWWTFRVPRLRRRRRAVHVAIMHAADLPPGA